MILIVFVFYFTIFRICNLVLSVGAFLVKQTFRYFVSDIFDKKLASV